MQIGGGARTRGTRQSVNSCIMESITELTIWSILGWLVVGWFQYIFCCMFFTGSPNVFKIQQKVNLSLWLPVTSCCLLLDPAASHLLSSGQWSGRDASWCPHTWAPVFWGSHRDDCSSSSGSRGFKSARGALVTHSTDWHAPTYHSLSESSNPSPFPPAGLRTWCLTWYRLWKRLVREHSLLPTLSCAFVQGGVTSFFLFLSLSYVQVLYKP